MPVDPAKLAALQKRVVVKAGGARQKQAAATKKPVVQEDKKLKAAINRLNCKDIPAIEEVNMFKEDGTMLVFKNPKVQAASGCYVVAGKSENKKVTDVLPDLLSQMGPDAMKALREQLYQHTGRNSAAAAGGDDLPAVDGTFETPALE